MISFIRSLFCKHDFVFSTNIHGDGIIQWNGRSLWRCQKCNKIKVESSLKTTKSVKDQWKEECPEFDYFDPLSYEKIIRWLSDGNKGSVAWEETFVNGKGEKRIDKKLAHWVFCWKFGFIGFLDFKEDEEKMAQKATALFVWLWLKKGIPAGFAEDLAEHWVRRNKPKG